MWDKLFSGIFDAEGMVHISVQNFLLCVGVALVLGLLLAFCAGFRSRSSGSFAITLALLPAVVAVVIMLVNGNVGAGVAVAGAFSLVRFRSAPGSGREISMIFLAMGAGLTVGMGYLGFAVLFTLVVGGASLVYTLLGLGSRPDPGRVLLITVPEDLGGFDLFEPVLEQYTASHDLKKVKTTNLGSLFKLTYDITLKSPGTEKALMDALRIQNGNLEVAIHCRDTAVAEL